MGYQCYPADGMARQGLEVYPHACYTVLLGVTPFPKYTLEGRLQRQLVLYEQKVNVPDPMLFFEEITRHRLLKGILPVDNLYTPSELDALIAAYTAWLAVTHPDQVTLLGDPTEGQLAIPTANMKARY
jgi:predicted RNase H-like nuclease